MKAFSRRHLLTSGAATLTLPTLLLSEDKGERANLKSFLVLAGEAREGHPLAVQGDPNGFAMKVRSTDGSQRYSVVECHTPPGRGPLLHIHPSQNELFFILHGSLGVQCGSQRLILNPGDTFMVGANVPHAFVTLGTEDSQHLNVFDPPGDMERFFQALASVLNLSSGAPDPDKLASVYTNHGVEIAGPPLQASAFAPSKAEMR